MGPVPSNVSFTFADANKTLPFADKTLRPGLRPDSHHRDFRLAAYKKGDDPCRQARWGWCTARRSVFPGPSMMSARSTRRRETIPRVMGTNPALRDVQTVPSYMPFGHGARIPI